MTKCKHVCSESGLNEMQVLVVGHVRTGRALYKYSRAAGTKASFHTILLRSIQKCEWYN